MSSRGRTDVETFQDFVFRFSKVMPEFDEEFRVSFMNFSFCASVGDCRVLQFEGMVEVFAFEEYKNLLSRQVLGDFEEFVMKGTILRVAFQLEHEDRTSAVSSSCCSRRWLPGRLSELNLPAPLARNSSNP